MRRFVPDRQAYKLFHDATIALSQIEGNGIRVDVEHLNRSIETTTERIKQIRKELKADPIFALWRKRFGNMTQFGSGKQLATVVFDILKHPRKEVFQQEEDSEAGMADEAAFADVDLPFVKNYFRQKKLDKALGTYLKGIKREVVYSENENGYFIHPNFNLHLATTYRSSSDNPNFQNIPKRNPEMAEIIRRCYVSRPGFMLGEIDFKGAEVRLACCYTKDPVLIEEFTTAGKDPHRDTACELFMLKPDQVDKGARDCAKNMYVFPQFYGSVYFQCAPNIWDAMHRRNFKIQGTETLLVDHLRRKGIKELGDCNPEAKAKPGTFVHHVQQVERGFWDDRFKVYTQWKRDYWRDYQRDGGFKMLTGFTCWGVFRRNMVLDYSIQGSAFHCMLWCLVEIQKWLRKNRMQTKIVGQIHDSIVSDIHPDERDDYLAKCQEVITVDLRKHYPWLIVPVEVEIEIAKPGSSWFDLEKVEI